MRLEGLSERMPVLVPRVPSPRPFASTPGWLLPVREGTLPVREMWVGASFPIRLLLLSLPLPRRPLEEEEEELL